jgi:transposase InsO family protein
MGTDPFRLPVRVGIRYTHVESKIKGVFNMKDQKKAEVIAQQRMELVMPLLAEELDAAKAKEIKASICEQTGISERTLRRYLARYRETGFEGLKPRDRERSETEEAIPPEVLQQAILLRRQVPSRSVSQLIQILEWEGKVEPGSIKRSTLQEKLANLGYSTRQMKLYTSSGIAARRFQKRCRNKLWHADLKFGPYLPIGKNGEKKQVYLVLFVDDATRYVLHGEFYPTLDQVIVEDCFRKAIVKYGIPYSVYFDNGKQFRTKWMSRACAKMEIRLLYARPYSPESTGKIERINQEVDSFLAEAVLEKLKTLERFNDLFQVWLEECYQRRPHSALKDNMSPETAYHNDSAPLRFLDPDTITQAFLHMEERKVDKAGCISFAGEKYEVGISFIGRKVSVMYDPADVSELTIEYPGHEPWKATKLTIGEWAGKRPKLPEHLTREEADSSRLLKAAEKENEKHKAQYIPAVSYRKVSKGGEQNV